MSGAATSLCECARTHWELPNAHMFWRTSRDGTYDMFPTATKAAVFFYLCTRLPVHDCTREKDLASNLI